MIRQTAQVFLLNLHDFDDTVCRRFYEVISPERRRKANRYRIHEDAVRCVMSEALVRYVYHHIRKKKEPPEFAYPPRGKPYLQNDLAFHFSISHTGMLVAVGYADSEIGIDIEQIDRQLDRESIAGSVFTLEEQAYIFEPFDEQMCMLRFTEMWTAKESYLKYLGCGFSKSPLSFSVDPESGTVHEKESGIVPGITVLSKRLSENYCLTVCGNIGNISLEQITYRSIMDVILQ